MLRYSKLDDIWDDKNLYGLPEKNIHASTNTNSIPSTPVKDYGPFVSRAFSETPLSKENSKEQTNDNRDSNTILLYSLFQEIKNKDQLLQYEREKQYKLKKEKWKNNASQYASNCNCEKPKKNWICLLPLLIVFIAFAIYVVYNMNKLEKRISKYYPENFKITNIPFVQQFQ